MERRQIRKTGNELERLPRPSHATVRRRGDRRESSMMADKTERLPRSLASQLQLLGRYPRGLDEMLTVNRLGLPPSSGAHLPAPTQSRTWWGTIPRACRK